MGKVYEYDFKGRPYRDKSYNDIIDAAKKEGFDSVLLKNTFDGGDKMTDIAVVFNPNQIRSKFAKFDPLKKDSANLLAGTGAAAFGLSALSNRIEEKKLRDRGW